MGHSLLGMQARAYGTFFPLSGTVISVPRHSSWTKYTMPFKIRA